MIDYLPHAFTEKGLYMLATVLKSKRAIQATRAIVETYAQVRAMVRDMEVLQSLKDGSVEQAAKLTQVGQKLASLITRADARGRAPVLAATGGSRRLLPRRTADEQVGSSRFRRRRPTCPAGS